MSAITETIAASLRSHRAYCDESGEELGGQIGRDRRTISNWERSGSLSIEDAWLLADHYGVALDDLVGRERS